MDAIDAYKSIFGAGSPNGQTILEDLRHFCKVDSVTYGTDPQEHSRILGRMEVFNRIAFHMRFTAQEKEAIRQEINAIQGEDDE